MTRLSLDGISPADAERLLLELQGKFAAAPGGATGAAPVQGDDVVNALLALGYSGKEADWAAKQLPAEVGVSDGIRQALKLLSKS